MLRVMPVRLSHPPTVPKPPPATRPTKRRIGARIPHEAFPIGDGVWRDSIPGLPMTVTIATGVNHRHETDEHGDVRLKWDSVAREVDRQFAAETRARGRICSLFSPTPGLALNGIGRRLPNHYRHKIFRPPGNLYGTCSHRATPKI